MSCWLRSCCHRSRRGQGLFEEIAAIVAHKASIRAQKVPILAIDIRTYCVNICALSTLTKFSVGAVHQAQAKCAASSKDRASEPEMERCNLARFAAVALGCAILIVFEAFAQTQPPTHGPAENGSPAWFLRGSFPDPGG